MLVQCITLNITGGVGFGLRYLYIHFPLMISLVVRFWSRLMEIAVSLFLGIANGRTGAASG